MKTSKRKLAVPPALFAALAKNLQSPSVIAPGEYPIRGIAAFALDCTVSQAAPSSAKATVRIDPARLVAAALHLSRVVIPTAGQLQTLVKEAFLIAVADDPVLRPELHSSVALVEDALARCKELAADALPRIERAGACRAPGSAELVDWRPA